MRVRPATADDIRHVCRNLRAINVREAFACWWDEDRDALAERLIRRASLAITHQTLAVDDGEAVVSIAAYLTGPGLSTVQMLATERWDEIAFPAFRTLKQTGIGGVLAHVRRAECMVLADNGDRRWLSRLGFVEEGRLVGRGKAGEDFVLLAWRNPSPPVDDPLPAVVSADNAARDAG